ncbi:Protein HRB1 [Pichia kudriavzevii]|uniref:Protein HRB1 n=1 Tax=Pichia kudriavzevii TaxID=4909 RepID=A0A1V2LU69_PICKU|nr:Protein HRB1 [Pichia kudriavzevii]
MFKLVMNYFNERLSSKAPIQREEETIFIIYRYKADNQLVRCLRPWILRIILEYVTSDKERGEEKRTILWLKSPARDVYIGEGRRNRSRSPRRDDDDRRYQSSYRGDSRRSRPPRRGPPPRGSYAQRSSDYEIKANRKYENSIFIGNLPYNTQWYEIKDHFASAGPIVRADVVTSHGKPRGMGTVEFQDRESAQNAIRMFDRTSFKEREIFVFIGNLPFSVKWQDLKDLFKEIGEVERADIIESTPGRSRGMGTVHFYNEADVEKAIERFNGFEWFGRKIDVRPSKFPKDDRAVPSTPKIRTDGLSKNTDFTLGVTGDGEESPIIYASNLPWETAESDLFELFGSIATVERAELQYGRGGNSSGNAVVKFSDVETARSVIQQLNGYEYGNRHLKITFAKFPSAEQLEALHEEIRKNTEETISSGLAEAPIERTSPVSEEHSKPAANPIEQSGAVDDGDEMIEE